MPADHFQTFLGVAVAVILIVEDEAQVRVLSESYLQEQGHRTLSAATVGEALAVLEGSEDIELLFTDIELQDDVQAGLDLARVAVQRRPDLGVLYTSAHTATDGMNALFVDNSAFLPKPYTVDQLQTILSIKFGIRPYPVVPPTGGTPPELTTSA
jgi:two-component system cell cycle sensor histidine kinase/response regulator CckA